MNIEYYRKNVYGKELVYVSDEEQALSIKKITGSVTLKPEHIEGLSELGFTFKQIIQS